MLINQFLAGCINSDLSRTVANFRSNKLSKMDAQIVKMAFQSSIYWIWRERN
ncbi:unnamed protein product, partial [Brassica oleracea]